MLHLVDLVRNSQTILRQLQEEAKLTHEEEERSALLSIAELVLDMILLNERQARTGSAEIDSLLVDRWNRPLDKRIGSKIMMLK
jgi:hypothetical protein